MADTDIRRGTRQSVLGAQLEQLKEHDHDLVYLGKTEKAADSDKLDGYHAADIALLAYPVGAIYMSYDSTSPATLFGGTWSALPSGYFLRVGTGGATGGSDTHAHSTAAVALTIGQMPYHNHTIWDLNWEVATGAGGPIATAYRAKYSPSGYAGGNEAHGHGNTGSASNVPAYYEVYAWRRTA